MMNLLHAASFCMYLIVFSFTIQYVVSIYRPLYTYLSYLHLSAFQIVSTLSSSILSYRNLFTICFHRPALFENTTKTSTSMFLSLNKSPAKFILYALPYAHLGIVTLTSILATSSSYQRNLFSSYTCPVRIIALIPTLIPTRCDHSCDCAYIAVFLAYLIPQQSLY
ncbi:hypothetical protein BDP27DRAFT_517717 [Rhodocollybia butyracea]|uniref:Uncharacterized protein n=1 Tax=Rhodocollybia butyracea TaxID=206335 RepID=A0A9P5U9V9_9AGAR|nr:hypothetical protein BDP27DRAFT_517717 [Rhodocollybia butyracea]